MAKSIFLGLIILFPQLIWAQNQVHAGVMKLKSPDIAATGGGRYEFNSSCLLRVRGKANSWLFGSYSFDDRYQLQPGALISEVYKQEGRMVKFDKLDLKVVEVLGNRSIARGQTKTGMVEFILDTSEEMIDIAAIRFTAKIFSLRFALEKI